MNPHHKPDPAETKPDDTGDGVNRAGLDYRAGYVEALGAALTSLQVMAMRATKKESAGLESAHVLVRGLRAAMIEKMKSGK